MEVNGGVEKVKGGMETQTNTKDRQCLRQKEKEAVVRISGSLNGIHEDLGVACFDSMRSIMRGDGWMRRKMNEWMKR